MPQDPTPHFGESAEMQEGPFFEYTSLEAIRKKLLDLGARNQLLNYKHPKAACVRIIDELPNQIYENLRNGCSFNFIPVPDPTENQLLAKGYVRRDPIKGIVELKAYPSAESWAAQIGLNTNYELPSASESDISNKHADLNIQTLLYSRELEARLREIRGKAQTAIEEGGTNILYLVLGFLEWYETRESENKRLAPLFTLPVHLERADLDRGVYRYAISLKDEGLLTNITLKEKLDNDFNLGLPDVSEDTTPEEYFDRISRDLLPHHPKWKLHRMGTLALLNFSKQVMYEDLNPKNWPANARIEEHPIVKRFFSSHEAGQNLSGASYNTEYSIDDIDDVHSKFPLIYDADSSQHSALIDAVNGESLVIEGPPGSGKSQTITNLIAACIANGKKVLFVAEKMAALSVVKSRLDRAGLGDFCLELHSHKTHKQTLVQDLANRLEKQGRYRSPETLDADIARYENLKAKLNSYVTVINSRWKNTGLTIHQILQSATRYREELKLDPDPLHIEGASGDLLTLVRQKELLDQAEMLVKVFGLVQQQADQGKIFNHHWFGVNNTELLSNQLNELCEKLERWTKSLRFIEETIKKIAEESEIDSDLLARLDEISIFVEVVKSLPDLIGGEPLSLIKEMLNREKDLNDILQQYESLYDQLDSLVTVFNPDVVVREEIPSRVVNAIKKIKSYGVLETESLENIHADFNLIRQVGTNIKKIADHLLIIKRNIPSDLHILCSGSVSSLKEIKTFFYFISSLPQALWHHRDSIYDAPEMDELLAQLTEHFRDLLPAHKALSEHFRLAELPSSRELNEWRNIIQNAGFLGFLSKHWRKARREVWALASSIKPNKKQLIELLPKLVEYKARLERVDEINQNSNLLGTSYKGIDTPLERIATLRAWYRSVRAEYGRGLSPRANLGDQLLTLDKDVALVLADMEKVELMETISKTLPLIHDIRRRFSQYEPLGDDETILISDDSPIQKLVVDLQKPLSGLLRCFKNSKLTLAAAMSSVTELHKYQKGVRLWKSNDLVKILFPTVIPLEIAPDRFNAKALDVAKNWVTILGLCSKSTVVYQILEREPDIERYMSLRNQVRDLDGFVTDERTDWADFKSLGQVNEDEWIRASDGKLGALISRNTRALREPKWLCTWIDFIRLRKKLSNNGVQNILRKLERGEMPATIFNSVVQMVLMHQLAKEVLTEKPELAEFSGLEQMAIREKYCDYDRRLLNLQREKVAFLAARASPPPGNCSGLVSTYSETCLIKHEAGKKARHLAVRALIDRAGRAIQTLKPCFMMSPMSVAQYLAPGKFEFDIVIMDEASQIRPEDALGAIARGKSLVVVGDPKQLPPTSFFDKSIDDEFNEDGVGVEEAESILDSTIPMFKTRRLRWHYRSKHESLIAFSNFHYYDSDLVIFPSPYRASPEYGVRYHYVSRGRFVRGKNAEEAKVIAKAALEHIRLRPDESIGLVAMNAEQKAEIEMHLEEIIKEDPQLEEAFNKNCLTEEPLFVKNLENVQGDERDVIMISMTYGPDEVGGRVFQRFGPINKDVGWRRLNVLFTRSKKRMHIFSSMSSSDILISSTSKRGVRSLKAFLEYCETGHLHTSVWTGRQPDSDFEIAVMRELQKHGYECEPQLGVAGYYLDLAVIDPGKPGRFLMGIECDGASYHSAKSARDRDRLRQEILEALGWKIHRVWSTDWFKNPESQLQPILNELALLRTEPQQISTFGDEYEYGIIQPSEDQLFVDEAESDDISLRDRLIRFEKEVVRKEFPNVEEDHRLLRPAMLESLLHHLPTSKEEFALVIPDYLRVSTHLEEARKFLDPVLEIISDYGDFGEGR